MSDERAPARGSKRCDLGQRRLGRAGLCAGMAALMLLAGCSGPTAAGCGGGAAAGMLLAGISAAVVKGNDESVDVGAAILGGALLGVVSGCTGAAIAESVYRANARTAAAKELPPPEPLYPVPAAAAEQPRNDAPGMVSEEVDLDGLHALWVARPERYPGKVGIRFERYAHEPSLIDCATFDVSIDGRSTSYPVSAKVAPQGTLILETSQTTIAIDDVRAMRTASYVELKLCDVRRRLTTAAAHKVASFLDRYDAIAPAAPAAAPSAATTTEPPSAAAPVATQPAAVPAAAPAATPAAVPNATPGATPAAVPPATPSAVPAATAVPAQR